MLVYNDSHLDSTASLNAVLRGQKRTKLLHTSGTCPGDGKKIIKSIFYQSHVIALGLTIPKWYNTWVLKKNLDIFFEKIF